MFNNDASTVANNDLLELDMSFLMNTLEDSLLPRCPIRRTLSETAKSRPNSPIWTCLRRLVETKPF